MTEAATVGHAPTREARCESGMRLKRPYLKGDTMQLTDKDRLRLRLKQDFLLMLVVDMSGKPEDLPIDEAGPTLAALRRFVFPEWEGRVNALLSHWAGEQRPVVTVPNWEKLVQDVTDNPELFKTITPEPKKKPTRRKKN